MAASALFLGALAAPGARADDPRPFDAARAFCERQTFTLKSMDEVGPWLDYFSGLRNGRSPAPDVNCPSSTVRAILNIVSSKTVEIAEAQRLALARFYVARAMEPELADRVIDPDGSFRYRNDIVLASFVWLLCPGRGEQRTACVTSVVKEFPDEFVETSPVFCDFAVHDAARVEWPAEREARPLLCARGGSLQSAKPSAWLRKAAISLGD
ncbi:hypothetical protein [Jiella mangrovi]|uniref:Uncharacterized protein n=1 Tax=Jiella mangrovi TaxID=2821407 RepID=A0ABS4BC45_9HYPH|nr:hypothetical protein [Jiella mangrovi]MBP0614320.1 hypothetical protein [Jiella mangrovi]